MVTALSSRSVQNKLRPYGSLFVYNKSMALPKVKYAIYPGTVATYDEDGNYVTDVTWSAADLAVAYGVDGEPYLTVTNEQWSLSDMEYFEYIHLKPRADGKYIDMLAEVEDTYRPDFDASKRWTNETDPRNIYPEIGNDEPENQRVGDFR